MEGGHNLGSSGSPHAKKLRMEKVEVEAEVTEEEEPSASSASDVRNKPRKARSPGNDDSREGEEDVSPFAGSVIPRRSQGMSQPLPVASSRVAPEMQKGQPDSAELIESSQASPPTETVIIESPAIQREDRLHVVPNDAYNSERMSMPSQLHMGSEVPQQPVRNLLEDQSIRGYTNVQVPMSEYAIPNTTANFQMPHSPAELQMDYSQLTNLNMQTQMGNGVAGRAQWAEWLHLHQQLAMHEPSTLLRLQDFQGLGYIPHDGVVTNNGPYATGAPALVQHSTNISQQASQGPGNYNILSSASPTFDPARVPATFTGMLGVRGPNLEANRLTEGGDPFGHSQMNTGYGDLVPTRRSNLVANRHFPQLASRPVSPAQAAPGRNRIPVPNSIYDPMYEALGLPVDPHLRLFLARQRDSGR
ncbi:hypothetical protein MLD38_027450 [Melastoma candidum]|uniref:Uncharacterized protein n=1 Tax=Melastoma candidum TaxID=119954 RepID=A0ACB9P1N2_9MYRT|nr:hypothetical protein MLD38_027450 [Melastoma candidum]